jgi:hypothetical protein
MIPRFRAWDTTKKEMFKDTFAITESGEVVIVEQGFVTDTPDYVFVDNLVIMQSTGLTDENEEEIFEGDILAVETDDGTLNVNVFWDEEHALFMFESKQYNEKEALAELLEDNSYPFEIIGNIYENQELLEVEDE